MTRTIHLDGESLITPAAFDAAISAEGASEPSSTDREAMQAILDAALDGFRSGKPAGVVVGDLAHGLHVARRRLPAAQWSILAAQARTHDLAALLGQDPLTDWSVRKPRGYSGDAGLLDIYYGHPDAEPLLAGATSLGRDIHRHTSDVPAAEAGRERCRILTRTVDEEAARVRGGARILSVAAGHLREAETSVALRDGTVLDWVALDQDPVSVETMRRAHAGTVVRPVEGSVLGLLRGAYDLGRFDLVYASGLLDYLQERTAKRLLSVLAGMLNPGGLLLVANFSDEVRSDGYMEAFMDWPLLLRSESDMASIMAGVPLGRDVRVWYGENRNVVYASCRMPA